jgi:hypothetical protein
MTIDYKAILDILVANDGACLAWQVPNAQAAIDIGLVRYDADTDLLVHPDALRFVDGSYTMKKG